MIDTPIIVRRLVDREDLILQRVLVVADDTELDVDAVRGGHSVWYAYPISKKLSIRFTVLGFWFRVYLLTEILENHHEEFQEITALGGVRCANVLAELLYMCTVRVKLDRVQDFVHPMAEHGIVDVQMVIVNKSVRQDFGEGPEFSQALLRLRQWREL